MIRTVFLKELKDMFRDKRTLMTTILIPILLFPLVINIVHAVTTAYTEKSKEKVIRIGFVGNAEGEFLQTLMALPDNVGKKIMIPYASKEQLLKDVKTDSIQLGMFVGPETASVEQSGPYNTAVEVYLNESDMAIEGRAKAYITAIDEKMRYNRYKLLQIDAQDLTPLEVSYRNVASSQEMIGKLVGGFLPYIFIAFGFMGCMYPAIDLFTGEKERGTIETLLTAPIPRWKILVGKMGVIVLFGLLAAVSALLGLFASVRLLDIEMSAEISSIVTGILTLSFVVKLFALLLPLTIFFAGVMIPLSIYAKSFKEAQSLITPFNIVLVLPAMIGFLPGVELNYLTSCIPIINIVLATKEMIAGTLQMDYLLLSFTVMVVFASLSVAVSYRFFGRESNIVS